MDAEALLRTVEDAVGSLASAMTSLESDLRPSQEECGLAYVCVEQARRQLEEVARDLRSEVTDAFLGRTR
mgnify:CR=1 FL=1